MALAAARPTSSAPMSPGPCVPATAVEIVPADAGLGHRLGDDLVDELGVAA